jgi:hypothetical protein
VAAALLRVGSLSTAARWSSIAPLWVPLLNTLTSLCLLIACIEIVLVGPSVLVPWPWDDSGGSGSPARPESP